MGMGEKETVEQTLRRAARESGLSMRQLTIRAGLRYQTVHGFCTRSRGITLASASALCEVLGLTLKPTKRAKG